MRCADKPTALVCVVAAAAVALASLVAALTLIWPVPAAALFPHAPHPMLAGTPGEVADIAATNLSALALPVLFAGAAGGRPGSWRLAGDVTSAALVSVNSLAVGAALALHGLALLAYLPHLPVEATALSASCSAWLRGRRHRRPLGRPVAVIVALTVIAAVIEVTATPHAPR